MPTAPPLQGVASLLYDCEQVALRLHEHWAVGVEVSFPLTDGTQETQARGWMDPALSYARALVTCRLAHMNPPKHGLVVDTERTVAEYPWMDWFNLTPFAAAGGNALNTGGRLDHLFRYYYQDPGQRCRLKPLLTGSARQKQRGVSLQHLAAQGARRAWSVGCQIQVCGLCGLSTFLGLARGL